MAPLTRSRYTPAELHQAIQDVISGQSGRFVSGKSKIPYLTLMRKVRESKAGTLVPPQRRGPPPILPRDCESDLVAWITAMQQDGHPVDRHMILIKGNQLVRQLDPLGSVSGGWYKRFMQRHTQLTSRNTGNFFSISKPAALRIASQAWAHRIVPTTIISGFRATGLWPLSLEKMVGRLKLFQDGGVPEAHSVQATFERRAVMRKAILTLPPQGNTRSTRKTIDVGGRILTLALLHDIDKSKAERAEATKLKLALHKKRAAKRKGKRGPKKAKRATGATSTDSSDYESPQSDEDDIVDSVVV
ncbi:hypothetical protein DYB37_010037 [Aphanomyces astaci]|uniref:HTH CENPB-type domain-containing protein n=1 Tax=Aphanomyces astaci TaxID=112090 RepID=A0A418EL37_APHAT|nr:hypothetical protein DYB37_010037 [Aphanomyces astaci]